MRVIQFVWSIEVHTIKNSNNLFIAQYSESKEDENYYYHCEIISIDKIKENITDYKNGIIDFGELISNSIVNECFINSYDNVEQILNIELDKYIRGWDSSYYEDAIINGIEQISDIDFEAN